MRFEHIIDDCFAEAIGPGGIERNQFEAELAAAEPAVEALRGQLAEGSLAVLNLPGLHSDLKRLENIALDLRARCRDFVVLGTGGSSLGAQAVTAIKPREVGPRLHFPDNLDGRSFEDLLSGLELRDSFFLTISKSGRTAETLAQTLAVLSACIGAGLKDRLDRHVLVVTEPGDSPLRRLAARWGLGLLDHDPDIGGRYSVLSLVGMLPALVRGLHAGQIRTGAGEVLARLDQATCAADLPAAVGAALSVAVMRGRGPGAHVLMPYADRLERFAMWQRQLWAESLGKDGHGSLPVRALGPVDQHSQLQLYLDGPADKFFTLMTLDTEGEGPAIATELAADRELGYLAGRTLGDLVAVEAGATARTLAARGRPVRRIHIPRLDEATIGALFMHFMLETIITGELLGVEVFGQPAVEEGKRLARQILEAS